MAREQIARRTFLDFRLREDTGLVEVTSQTTQNVLGEIREHPAWSRHVFVTVPGTIFDSDALREIASFMDAGKEVSDAKTN